ncbi:hypothetical protein ACG04Q_20805 [Roseateles sp. DXS20W]|uniref:DUF4365 domain-containing protein n=1 Tax=Pelomonas lactea TaxID=3299030 RepID=A0ABW7GQL8_9BURK
MKTDAELVSRRAELLAQLFLEDLGPKFLSKAPADFGFDFVVGFSNSRGGVNLIAVEVKAGERIQKRIQMKRSAYQLLGHSNVPGLVLVIDVKSNTVLYNLVHPVRPSTAGLMVSLQLVEANDERRDYLRRLFSSDEGAPPLSEG